MFKRLIEVDLSENINNRVYVTFMARDVEIRFQKDQVTKYISLNMYDRGKCVDAKLFGAKDYQLDMVENGKIYSAVVDVKPYEKSPLGYSCLLYNIDVSKANPRDFVEWTPGVDSSYVVLKDYVDEIYDSNYGRIAHTILNKHWSKFSKWVAAKSMHHEKLGGLLVHTAEVMVMADSLIEVFNGIYGEDFIDRNLVLSAILLHDVCKVRELNVDTDTGSVEYSVGAALTSHIMDAISEVDITAYDMEIGMPDENGDKSVDQIDLEKEEVKLLKHCIAAHHGKLEYGSPITPSIPEAMLIHFMDNLSAEMYRFNEVYKEVEGGKSFTSWSGGGMKNYYKKSK